jgi:hypothetical protein
MAKATATAEADVAGADVAGALVVAVGCADDVAADEERGVLTTLSVPTPPITAPTIPTAASPPMTTSHDCR